MKKIKIILCMILGVCFIFGGCDININLNGGDTSTTSKLFLAQRVVILSIISPISLMRHLLR